MYPTTVGLPVVPEEGVDPHDLLPRHREQGKGVVRAKVLLRHERNRGSGTAVTATVSQLLLDRGYRFCFLYTDHANPTSNSIYVRIGYEPVCDSRELAFSAR